MSFRVKELEQFSSQVTWLDGEDAARSYEYAMRFSSRDRNGLESAMVERIEHHVIESQNVALAWLRTRVPSDEHTVRVVFGPDDVLLASTRLFLERWQDMFVPARDDAVVLPDRATWVLFYNHEDELELGWRRGEAIANVGAG